MSQAAELQPDELERLRRDLGRSIGQQLAVDQLEPEAAHASLAADMISASKLLGFRAYLVAEDGLVAQWLKAQPIDSRAGAGET